MSEKQRKCLDANDCMKQIFIQSEALYYPDLDSDVSFVWNFWPRSSEVIRKGNQIDTLKLGFSEVTEQNSDTLRYT